MAPNELRQKADTLHGLPTDAVMLLYEAAEHIEALQYLLCAGRWSQGTKEYTRICNGVTEKVKIR